MKWTPQDIEMYAKSKEYVDTVVISLFPVSFGQEMKQSASMSEFLTLLTNQLERLFTGRILTLPPFTYLKNGNNEQWLPLLKQWEKKLQEEEVKHIVYLTSDSDWKMNEAELEGTLIWMPSLPLETMDDSQKFTLVQSQVKQLQQLVTQKWQENE
ncbi:MAG: YpiF family protein [Bacillota bacterium]|nr:YpiF family protein [Bacillota bacterium]